MKKKTIGVVGTRRRNSFIDYLKVCNKFESIYNEGDTICSGLCPSGADAFAVQIAYDFDTRTLWFPADWETYGKAAGFIRNTAIAENSDVLIACVAPDREGGTEDTIKKFVRLHGSENLHIIK